MEAYVKKRENLNRVCPIIKKIHEVEKIKCGINPNLNVKDLKHEIKMMNKDEYPINPIVTMDDLDDSQHP